MGIQKWRGKHTYIYIHTHIHMYIYIYTYLFYLYTLDFSHKNCPSDSYFGWIFCLKNLPGSNQASTFFFNRKHWTLGFAGSHGPRCYGAICQGGFCTCGSRGIGKLFRVGFRWKNLSWADFLWKNVTEMEQIEEIGQKPTVQSTKTYYICMYAWDNIYRLMYIIANMGNMCVHNKLKHGVCWNIPMEPHRFSTSSYASYLCDFLPECI